MQSENEGKPLELDLMSMSARANGGPMALYWTRLTHWGQTILHFPTMAIPMGKQMPQYRSIPSPTMEPCTSPESSPQNALPELLPAILQLVEQMAQTNEYLAQIISQDYADDSSSETGSDETLTGKPGRIISQREFRTVDAKPEAPFDKPYRHDWSRAGSNPPPPQGPKPAPPPNPPKAGNG